MLRLDLEVFFFGTAIVHYLDLSEFRTGPAKVAGYLPAIALSGKSVNPRSGPPAMDETVILLASL